MINAQRIAGKGVHVTVECANLHEVLMETLEIVYSIGESVRHRTGDFSADVFWRVMAEATNKMKDGPQALFRTVAMVDLKAARDQEGQHGICDQ